MSVGSFSASLSGMQANSQKLQVIGNNQQANYAYATELLKRIRTVPLKNQGIELA